MGGYGHVKWVAISGNGDVKKGMFPSVAALAASGRSGEGNGMSTLRTVIVNVGEYNYVVGRDAYLETDANFSRTRLGDYSQTDGYKALMLGAMAISGMREVNQLVIGLPMSTISNYHAILQETYKGEHFIGAANAKRKNVVTVDHVTVTSQPAGALVHAAKIHETLRKKTSLLIDVGYFTVDFLMCQGMRPYYARSGAVEGGMSSYYDLLGEAVAGQLEESGFGKKSRIHHFLLEKALTEGTVAENGTSKYTLMIGNQHFDISESVMKTKVKLHSYLDQVITGIQPMSVSCNARQNNPENGRPMVKKVSQGRNKEIKRRIYCLSDI